MDRCSRGASVRRSLLIATLLAVGACEAVAQFPPFMLNPKTYRDRSGRYELAVDPSDVGVSGNAKYRLTDKGTDRWSAAFPFALSEAAVTESGATVGYGYNRPKDREFGELLVVILGADGKVRLSDPVKLEPSPFPDSYGGVPNAIGLVVDEPNDRLIVRVAGVQWRQLESWWIYRLSTATTIGKQDLSKLWQDTEPYRHVSAIRPIHGTPLTLVHFVRNLSRLPRGNHGATFALLDLQGRLVWELELPFDYMASDRETRDKLAELLTEGRCILRSDQPRDFDLFFAAASQRVSYSVAQRASGEWTVKETAREPYTLIPAAKRTLMMLPKRALKPLEPLALPMRRSAPPLPIQQTDELGAVTSIAIDPKGQIYAIDRKTGAMYVFDSSGRVLHICPATLKDFSGLAPGPAISFGDQGDVYLGPGEGIEGLDRRCPYAHFDANGKRLNPVIWIGFTSWLQPRTNHLIELSFEFAALNDPSGKTIRELGVRPDGRRLSGVEFASVAPDGSFAILATQYEQGGETLNVFTADGDPICTIPLPGLIGVIEMAYDGHRIVVAAEQGLFFFDRSGTALYRCESPLSLRHDSVQEPYLLEDGRRLALFDGRKPVLYRYQLP
jgi:hypothetical protein